MYWLTWFIPEARAERTVAAVPNAVNVCKSYFNFLRLPCAGDAGASAENSSIFGLISRIIVFILEISASVAVGFIIYAGFVLITASAVPEKAAEAKKILTYAIVGLVVISFAFVITTAIKSVIFGMSFT